MVGLVATAGLAPDAPVEAAILVGLAAALVTALILAWVRSRAAAKKEDQEVITFAERARGALLGLAVGDALGAPVEFKPFGSFPPVTGFQAGGPFNLPAGHWTDDTSMALCLADSLIANSGYDSFDVMDRYRRWVDDGYRSSLDYCFDIGNQSRQAIRAFRRDPVVPLSASRVRAAGNAPVMRLAPIGIVAAAAHLNQADTIRLAMVSARETHFSTEAEEATAIFGHLLRHALSGTDEKDIVGYTGPDSFGLIDYLNSLPGTRPADVANTGYIRHTVGSAWWAFRSTRNFRDGALAVVNLGDDADTAGAVYGQLAGAYYGVDGIPHDWLDGLHEVNEIARVADALAGMTAAPVLRTRFAEDDA